MQVSSFIRTKASPYTLGSAFPDGGWGEVFWDSLGFGVETCVGAMASCATEAQEAFSSLRCCLITPKSSGFWFTASSLSIGCSTSVPHSPSNPEHSPTNYNYAVGFPSPLANAAHGCALLSCQPNAVACTRFRNYGAARLLTSICLMCDYTWPVPRFSSLYPHTASNAWRIMAVDHRALSVEGSRYFHQERHTISLQSCCILPTSQRYMAGTFTAA